MFLTELPDSNFPHPSINHYQANISKTEIDNIILLCAHKPPKTFHCLHNEVNNYLAQKFLQFGFKYFFLGKTLTLTFLLLIKATELSTHVLLVFPSDLEISSPFT